MDIFVPRQPQERLYLMRYDPKTDTSNYLEVAFLGWSAGGYEAGATPIGLRGQIHINACTDGWIIELGEDRFTSQLWALDCSTTSKTYSNGYSTSSGERQRARNKSLHPPPASARAPLKTGDTASSLGSSDFEKPATLPRRAETALANT
jgi:hypothetical protein